MHPAIIIGTVRSLWTWLWGRYHVPQNVFLVLKVFKLKCSYFRCQVCWQALWISKLIGWNSTDEVTISHFFPFHTRNCSLTPTGSQVDLPVGKLTYRYSTMSSLVTSGTLKNAGDRKSTTITMVTPSRRSRDRKRRHRAQRTTRAHIVAADVTSVSS